MPGTITTDAQILFTADNTTGLENIGGGAGAGLEADIVRHPPNALSRKVNSNIRGHTVDFTTPVNASGAVQHIYIWKTTSTPGLLAATNGLRLRYGSNTNNASDFEEHGVQNGSDEFPSLFNWLQICVNLDVLANDFTPAASAGTANTASIRQVGGRMDSTGSSKSENFAFDKCSLASYLRVSAGTSGSPATFEDFVDYDQVDETIRIGIIRKIFKAYFVTGELGIDGAYFRDGNKTVTFLDQRGQIADGHNKLRVTSAAGPNVIWDADGPLVIQSQGAKKFDYIAENTDGSVAWQSGSSFLGYRQVQNNSLHTWTSQLFSDGDQVIPQSGATISDCTIRSSNAVTAFEMDDAALATNISFINCDRALDATAAIVSDQVNINGHQFSNCTFDVRVNSANNIVLNPLGGTNVSTCENIGAGNCSIAAIPATFTLTGLKNPSKVFLFNGINDNDPELDKQTVTGGVYSYPYSYTGDINAKVRIISLAEEVVEFNVILSSANQSIPIGQRTDRNYKNI